MTRIPRCVICTRDQPSQMLHPSENTDKLSMTLVHKGHAFKIQYAHESQTSKLSWPVLQPNHMSVVMFRHLKSIQKLKSIQPFFMCKHVCYAVQESLWWVAGIEASVLQSWAAAWPSQHGHGHRAEPLHQGLQEPEQRQICTAGQGTLLATVCSPFLSCAIKTMTLWVASVTALPITCNQHHDSAGHCSSCYVYFSGRHHEPLLSPLFLIYALKTMTLLATSCHVCNQIEGIMCCFSFPSSSCMQSRPQNC